MIALVISACFYADPASCRAYRVPMPEETNALSCTLFAQPFLAQWAAENPGLRITKWRCATALVADI